MKTLIDDNAPEFTPQPEPITPQVEIVPQPEPKKKDNTALNLVIIAGMIILALIIINKYFKEKE